MLNQIINTIVPIAITAIVGMVTAVIKTVGEAGVEYINKKKEAVVQKIGADKYNNELQFARSAWGMVDEHFRISPELEKTFQAKQAEFDKIVAEKFPELTSDEISQLRQTVAGEINKGKVVVTAPATVQTK